MFVSVVGHKFSCGPLRRIAFLEQSVVAAGGARVLYRLLYIVCVQVRSKVASRRRYPSIVPSLVKLTS